MFSISPKNDLQEGAGKILCCQCGALIDPNPANMCVGCLRTNIDITEGIPKQATIQFCRGCERYFQPPTDWVHCSLESRELLQLCLRKLKGLNRVKLVDAGFVWTEPHSKRIKVKLTVHGEVLGGTVLQQVFIVEYTIANQMCDDCHRTEAKDFWKAMVQIRQKAENKKTFYYLEQLILKHKAHENTLGIKQIHEGIDFYYSTEAHARRMVDFLNTVIPCRYQHSRKLLSHDIHSNIYNYKFTFSVELVPISKNSVVCLSKRMTQQMGGIRPLCLVLRVTNTIHLIDPCNAQLAEVNSMNYWRDSFSSVFNPKQLTEYVVMEVEQIPERDKKPFPGQGPISNKHVVCDVYVVKSSEVGLADNWIHTQSHLGHLLKPFDKVLGYNVHESNINDDNFDKINKDFVPDVILVKKFYERRRKRPWKLKHLQMRDDSASVGSANRDYAEFLEDLEEDPNYRRDVNIYRNRDIMPVDTDDMDDPAQPRITLEEMLDDMCI